MKNFILKRVCVLALVAFGATTVSAQGFLKKIQKAAETVTNITGTDEQAADSTATAAEDSQSVDSLLTSLPTYRVVKVVETDANGDTIRNEDQTVRYTYRVLDQDDKVCDPNTAKKHLKAALKSGGAILAKVGVGAGIGVLAGSGKSTKEKLMTAGIGTAVGVLASTSDIKELKKQLKLRKQYLQVISDYQTTFTDEGVPVDASADLSAYDDCETISRSAELVAQELMASREEGSSISDLSEDDWDIKL